MRIAETLRRWLAPASPAPASAELIKARQDLKVASEAAIRAAVRTHNEITNISLVLDDLHTRFKQRVKDDVASKSGKSPDLSH